eukprot:1491596-Rhodomonas_salina.4
MQGRGQSSQPSCPIADLRQELCSSAAQLASWQQHHNQCCTPPRQRGIRIAKLTIAFLCQPPHPAPNRRTPRQFQSTRHAGTVHGDRRHAVTPSGNCAFRNRELRLRLSRRVHARRYEPAAWLPTSCSVCSSWAEAASGPGFTSGIEASDPRPGAAAARDTKSSQQEEPGERAAHVRAGHCIGQ